MGNKKRIVVCWSNRSEWGLLEPVLKRLSEHFEVIPFSMECLNTSELGNIYKSSYLFLSQCKPNLVITPFDRYEQIFVALAAQMLNLKVAQIHAGDLSREGCWDDQVRHMISLCCDYLFCNSEESARRARELIRLTGSSAKVYEVGSTAFDDISFKEGLVPSEEYCVVLYNPPTKHPELIPKELHEIEAMLDHTKPTFWIEPNGDPGSDLIISRVKDIERKGNVKLFSTLPRREFLALLRHASRFISNSSCLFYEAPHFLKPEQIIHIGARNKGREHVKVKTGGSDRIAEILRKELETT